MHHHPVVVVNRATSQETTGEEDMDTVPAPQPGGRNGIHIHVPGGHPGGSPADHPATSPTKWWWIDFHTSTEGAVFPGSATRIGFYGSILRAAIPCQSL